MFTNPSALWSFIKKWESTHLTYTAGGAQFFICVYAVSHSFTVFTLRCLVNFCYRELPRPVLWLDDPKNVPNVSQLYGFSHQVLKHNIVQRKAAVFNRERSTSRMPFDPINSALISSMLSSARYLQRFFKLFNTFLQSISNTKNDTVEDSRASQILQLHTGYFLNQN